MARQYGFEAKDFLIWGYSNSAQFAGRLALQKPEYFLAVHMHNPGSFDKPNLAAAGILWGLTMGEVDSGYGRAVKFQQACLDAKYRIMFKAVQGMGHDNDRGSRQLATLFFEYARSLPKEPVAREAKLRQTMDNPEYWGDWLNQTVERRENKEDVPVRLRVPLPTALMAQAWERVKPLAPEDDPAEGGRAK